MLLKGKIWGGGGWGRGKYWNSVLPAQCFYKPKAALKLKQNKTHNGCKPSGKQKEICLTYHCIWHLQLIHRVGDEF